MNLLPPVSQLLSSVIMIVVATALSLTLPDHPSIQSLLQTTSTDKPVALHNSENNHDKKVTPTPTSAQSEQTKVDSKPVVTAHGNTKNTVNQTNTTNEQATTQTNSNDNSGQNPTTAPTIAQSIAPTAMVTHIITAKSTIHASGKTITLIMTYPNTGGNINGTMSGDCKGTITGKYDGPSTNKLAGSAKANCPEGFLTVPVTITYTGRMASNDKQATINYTASALGQSESGTSVLLLSQ